MRQVAAPRAVAGAPSVAAVGVLAAGFDRAGVADSDVGGFARALSDSELLAQVAVIGEVRRHLERVEIALATEVAQRSQRGDESSLARRNGQKSGADLIAVTTGGSARAARVLIAIGTVIAPLLDELGDELPPVHPHVAEALASGTPLAVGTGIIGVLDRVKGRVSAERLLRLEAELVDRARQYASSVDSFLVWLRQVPNLVDPEGAADRVNALRSQRSGSVHQQADGMTRFSFLLDPESAAYVITAITARTAPRRQVFDNDVAGSDPAVDDVRTSAQRCADAFVTIAKQAMTVDEGVLAWLPRQPRRDHDARSPRVEDRDRDPRGHPRTGQCVGREAHGGGRAPDPDGPRQPVEVLDLGVRVRLHSPAQRTAMAARDGGCVFTDCLEPPDRCEAAHIDPAREFGPTSLENGIVLCSYHHHRFELDGWAMFRGADGAPWFVPPASVDRDRRPRRGGPPARQIAA